MYGFKVSVYVRHGYEIKTNEHLNCIAILRGGGIIGSL